MAPGRTCRGGVKNSGNGFREPGTEALDVDTEWKTVVINHDPGKCEDRLALRDRWDSLRSCDSLR